MKVNMKYHRKNVFIDDSAQPPKGAQTLALTVLSWLNSVSPQKRRLEHGKSSASAKE